MPTVLYYYSAFGFILTGEEDILPQSFSSDLQVDTSNLSQEEKLLLILEYLQKSYPDISVSDVTNEEGLSIGTAYYAVDTDEDSNPCFDSPAPNPTQSEIESLKELSRTFFNSVQPQWIKYMAT